MAATTVSGRTMPCRAPSQVRRNCSCHYDEHGSLWHGWQRGGWRALMGMELCMRQCLLCKAPYLQ